MSQHSVAVANEAAKNPELLGETNQPHKDEQVKAIKEQEKARKATAKANAENRNSFVDQLDGSENGVAAQSGPDALENAKNEDTDGSADFSTVGKKGTGEDSSEDNEENTEDK